MQGANMEKLIITAAICGAEVTKENNPAVPYSLDEIIREAKSAYEAGASIIHLHVREDDGTPTQKRERFQTCIDAIKSECKDVIIQPSTGGAVGMSDMERLDSCRVTPAPEFASLDCGSLNFGPDDVFVNTHKTIMNFAQFMRDNKIKPELEVFDKGMIDIALSIAKKGFFLEPLHFNFVLGVQMTGTLRDLVFMVDSIPSGCTWTASGIGKYTDLVTVGAIVMGGHVRVGLEDNIYLKKGVLAKSNGELVARVVEIADIVGREIATPNEARKILSIG
jgi:3-keto-5-aminohexanoate cleavage enzyme